MFCFKQFIVEDHQSTMKVCTDSVILGAWANVGTAWRILDIGTGCGLLALMCAQRSSAYITGIDNHLASVDQANENFCKSAWNTRLEAKHIDFKDFDGESFDYIITNPPFFINNLKVKNPTRNLARHTDGFQHELLLHHCKRMLNHIGTLGILLPPFEARCFEQKAIKDGFYPIRKLFISSKLKKDYYIVSVEYSLIDRPCKSESLIIYTIQQALILQNIVFLQKIII